MASINSDKKILFIKQHSANAKFVLNDIEILKEQFSVSVYNTRTTNNPAIIFTLFKQFIYLLFNVYKFKLVYIWFADYHSFFPVLIFKLFRKKSIICAGGYEATYIPEINCGVFTNDTLAKSIRRFAVTFSLKNCDYILPVDESLILNENTYIYSDLAEEQTLKDGIKHFLPDIKTPIKTVYPGYDPVLFSKKKNTAKEKTIMCAGLVPNEHEIKRKGFDILIECARIMAEVKFVFIGFNEEQKLRIQKLGLKNLYIYSMVTYDELIEHYSKAKVFAQISMFEGLPSTICEAMLCECIPAGSNVNGIPKIIGNCGFIIMKKDLNEIINILKRAVESPEELGRNARLQIINNFSIEKRKNALFSVVNELIN